ncbi:UNVERIFIED_CONTAM: Polyphenol oxidase, chloroplastic [Sesamum angustifolium]|uniref:Polyphenol oxidase, chloroplastic n=1 Tax=Sesamum angustifolium TaxID=2727405 RepID=A0AAW2KYF0_9LAMI
MASLSLSWSSPATGLPSQPHFSIKPPHSSTYTTRTRRCTWSCKATNGGQNEKHSPQNVETSQGKLDRRNLLLGMGGLYGAAVNLVSDRSPALATPITSPDLSKCSTGTNLNTQQPLDVNCCPPVSKEIIDYKLPPVGKMRFRPAAHLAGEDYYAKFEKAVGLMKALPPEDPRNFMQQANVHCAYCNLTYQQTGDPKLKLQIHNCWHFFPWHRWYLYFFERILGKLIDDPTFGLPFWNWDNPDGMIMPEVFARKDSPLFDARRNTSHLPPALADLAYSSKSPTNPKKIIPIT